MSCKKCEKAQQDLGNAITYEWDNAIVKILGCNNHVSEICRALDKLKYNGGS